MQAGRCSICHCDPSAPRTSSVQMNMESPTYIEGTVPVVALVLTSGYHPVADDVRNLC